MKGYLTELLREHKHNLVHLGFLTDAAERIALRGINSEDMELIHYSVKFLSKELGDHCRKEEQLLYPELRNHTDAMELLILSNEHDTIEDAMKMYEEIVRCAMNESPGIHPSGNNGPGKDTSSQTMAQRLKKETRTFVRLLSDHIRREDAILYAAAQRELKDSYPEF